MRKADLPSWMAMAASIALVLASVADAAPPRKPVGWVLDPYFVELPGGHDQPDVSHDFYPKGQTPASWTERILLRSQPAAPGTSPMAVLDAMGAAFRKQCPEMGEFRMTVPGDDDSRRTFAMRSCHENPQTHRGQEIIQKVLVAGDRAYVMTAEGDYPAFAKDATPLQKIQQDRWLAMEGSLVSCDVLTDPRCWPDSAAIMKASPAPLTDGEAAAVRLAENRGLELYRQDQLAWHATDFAMAHGGLKPSDGGSFIAVPGSGKAGDVYFIQHSAGRFTGATHVVVDAEGEPARREELTSLPDEVAARERALKVARDEHPDVCSYSMNSAVMPADRGDGWWAYILTATTEPGVMFLGGHTRIHVSTDGKVLRKEPSARSCLAVHTDERGPNGEKSAMSVVSHLVSDVPWETHVFQSLTFNVPIIVITDHAVWRVENGHITRLDV